MEKRKKELREELTSFDIPVLVLRIGFFLSQYKTKEDSRFYFIKVSNLSKIIEDFIFYKGIG